MLYLVPNLIFRAGIKHVNTRFIGYRLSQAVRTMASDTENAHLQTIVRDGQEYTEVREGLARILVPFTAKESTEKTAKAVEEQQKVFYNPIQQFNRDLTVLAIKAHGEGVLATRRSSHNANRVAKRKRDKCDAAGDRPAKQDKVSDPMEGVVSTADIAKHDETPANEGASSVPAIKDGQDQGPGQSSANTNGGAHDISPNEVPQADQPAEALPSSKGENPGTSDFKQNDHSVTPRFTVFDALSATGLRALRYAQELPFVTSVTANDLTTSAVEAIKRNAEHNGVESKVNVTQGDARAHMYSLLAEEVPRELARNKPSKKGKEKRYDVIDLDPYGTAAPFFDSAINAVRDDGGLLCVTCTDSGVWASHGYSEKAFALYGGIPVKGFYSHEAGLRLILHGLATTAARYGLAIEPLLSLSVDYYIRIFVKVRKSPAQVKFLAGKTMLVYNCDQGCGAWETQILLRNKKVPNKSGKGVFYKHGLSMAPTTEQHCKHCGSKMHLAGPMYAGPLHSPEFIKKILDDLPNVPDDVYGTKSRIEGVLHTALEEFIPPPEDTLPSAQGDEFAALDPYPFFFHPSGLAGTIHCICPDEDSFRGALRHLGYTVTRSHCKPGSLKTNAPWSVIWHIMREWVRQKEAVKVENITEHSPAYTLLRLGKQKDDTIGGRNEDNAVDKMEVVFDQKLGRDTSRRGLVRYQANPRENWGPLTRAKGY
ncbi:dimethylguanosine tRNA methyltransferase [Xylariaceae sp. FL0662B]|nr:dimethylguanosine tRNA methyltransferase [Xylariaceae sp. FL0662B]